MYSINKLKGAKIYLACRSLQIVQVHICNFKVSWLSFRQIHLCLQIWNNWNNFYLHCATVCVFCWPNLAIMSNGRHIHTFKGKDQKENLVYFCKTNVFFLNFLFVHVGQFFLLRRWWYLKWLESCIRNKKNRTHTRKQISNV